jgi:hypothetical protein
MSAGWHSKKKWYRNGVNVPAMFLFVTCFVPGYWKGVFVASIVLMVMVFIFCAATTQRLALARPILVSYLLCMAFNGLFIVNGSTDNASNAAILESLLLYMVYPTVYMVFVDLFSRRETVMGVAVCLDLILIVASVIILVFGFFTGIAVDDATRLRKYAEFANPSLLDEREIFEYLERLVSFLSFLLPFCVAKIVLAPSGIAKTLRWRQLLLCLLAVAAAIVGGRRVLYVLIFFAIVVSLSLRVLSRPQLRRVVIYSSIFIMLCITVLGVVCLGPLCGVLSHSPLEQLEKIVTQDPRFDQVYAGIEEANKRVVFGRGLGTFNPTFIRSVEKPWHYEVTYVRLLWQIGLGGLLIYITASALSLYKAALLCVKNEELLCSVGPFVVAFICVLVAAVTNPYFESFKTMWMFFLPLAVSNWVSLHCGASHCGAKS